MRGRTVWDWPCGRHPCDARNTRLGAAGVIEHAVARLHLVAHKVARLVVAHAGPGHSTVGGGQGVVDRAFLGFGFHQPVAGARVMGAFGSRGFRIPSWESLG